jgi:hypothetical protein
MGAKLKRGQPSAALIGDSSREPIPTSLAPARNPKILHRIDENDAASPTSFRARPC